MTVPGDGARPSAVAPKRTGMAWIVRGVCAAAVAAVAIAGASPAEALRCDRTDNDRAEASRAIRVLTGEIDAMERAIIEALAGSRPGSSRATQPRAPRR